MELEKNLNTNHIRECNPYHQRFNYSRIKSTIPVPNLLEVQQSSYEKFLQLDIPAEQREDIGMQEVFKGIFPITNFNETSSLEFVSYEIGNWECSCGKNNFPMEKKEEKKDIFKFRHQWQCACGKLRGHSLLEKETPKLCKECGTYAQYIKCRDCNSRPTLKMKYDVEECKQLGLTFAAPLKITVRLVVWDKDPSSGEKRIRDAKEQQVYLGEMPLMTNVYTDPDGTIRVGNNGTFIINGTERVIVSQLHRSPGVFFGYEKGKGSASGKLIYSARIIPYRGSWLEFEFDNRDILNVRIDRKKKLPASILLRAIGLNTTEQILAEFYQLVTVYVEPSQGVNSPDQADVNFYFEVSDRLKGEEFPEDIKIDEETTIKAGTPVSAILINRLLKSGITRIPVSRKAMLNRIVAKDIFSPHTGEILVEAGSEITKDVINKIAAFGITSFYIITDRDGIGDALMLTVRKDKISDRKAAQKEIYRVLRPGDPLTEDGASSLFHRLFFDPKSFDLSRVGRMKINRKLGLVKPDSKSDPSAGSRVLEKRDIIETIRYLLKLKNGTIGKEGIDDIDHLGNRRVRSVGELLQNQLRIGLARIEKAIKERMSLQDVSTAMPYDLINSKPVTATIKEFFGSSQLSQFMDQTNPLAELTHKRRLSALGPGGLSRERAGFEVRDVHPTHYGRICPIETPEGPNVGLITSLSCYAKVNDLGFIETPYRIVKNKKVLDEVKYLSALDEAMLEIDEETGEKRQATIAQANAPVDERTRKFIADRISARQGGESVIVPADEVNYMDVSPKQLVSVSTALIPFLEHDDANRALMGSNMQRQAVPLLRPEAPIIGTGMESVVAYDSGAVVIAKNSGVVESVTSSRIIIRVDNGEGESQDSAEPKLSAGVDVYNLVKFQRSNQDTCINYKPIVRKGDKVVKGQVIADGPATDKGDLALGRNVLTAFLPWQGYNFEDAVLISERVLEDDMFTSIHIEEFEISARETKLGKEEITRDIPGVSEDKLRNLDENGIIRIGAEVQPGDVLVGKVTPKGETQLTPEEKLLRAIFGEKAGDVRDASLKVRPGVYGTVIDVKVFSRRGVDKDKRSQAIEDEEALRIESEYQDQISIIIDDGKKKLIDLLAGNKILQNIEITDKDGKTTSLFNYGDIMDKERLEKMSWERLCRIDFEGDLQLKERFHSIQKRVEEQCHIVRTIKNEKLSKLKQGDELPPGVIKMVKVYVAAKRKLQVGDKMAGRHGNKGVLAKIVKKEDMPYLPDGTPIDLILNPLGVPSRMNVGQIMEIHLGWAAGKMGIKIATPVFDGARESDIKEMLVKAGLPPDGQTILYDGRTGEPFDKRVTVGYMYMMKLIHLVDDKIHARSIGPYSLVTQQPLGGKAQFGGQRFGEMEVWALEAYGAAYTLQELLTVKSDDVSGRNQIYKSIVKGSSNFQSGLPESFNVLVKELKSLALDVELINTKEKKAEKPEELFKEE